MMDEYTVRVAKKDDAEELLNIYTPYITDTAITFEYDVPSLEEFAKRIETVLKKYPYYVALKDDEIVGYAYAGTFKGRAAYDWSVETSIYVRMDEKGHGIGKLLYFHLEEALKKMNVTNVNACIAVPYGDDDPFLTRDSVKFHEHMGYTLVGEFHQCAYKFNRWYNMVWMEKFINEHGDEVKEFIPFQN